MTQKSSEQSWYLIALLGVLAGLTPLAIDMYLPALPAIADEFDTKVAIAQLSVSFYLVGFAVGQLFYGPLTDAFGRMPILAVSLTVFAFASFMATLVNSVEALIAMRVLQALGGAGGSVVVMAMMRDLYQREQFSRAMSFVMLVMNLAPLLAPVLGGFLLTHGGWRVIFYLLMAIAIGITLAMLFAVGETLAPEKRQRLSLKQAIGQYGNILAHRQTRMYLTIGMFNSAALFLFITGSSYVYIRYFGVPEENFGYLFGINVVMMMVLTSLNARYVARLGSHKMLRIGLWITALGGVTALVAAALGTPHIAWVIGPVILIMAPLGLVAANSTSLSLDAYGKAAGSVAAIGGALRFTSGAVAGMLLSAWHPQSPQPMLLAMAVCSVLALGYYELITKTAVKE